MQGAKIALGITFLVNFPCLGQNGKIIERSVFTLPDFLLQRMERRNPSIRETLASVEMNDITYESDGLRVRGYLLAPKGKGPYPCVIYNRGGNQEFGALTRGSVAGELAKIAAAGYIVVASQYRGNRGGDGKEEFGGADLNDVLNLIPLLESLPESDPTRIGMIGASRGGMMTYMAMTKTNRITAAIVLSGSADQFLELERRPEMEEKVFKELIPNFTENREAELVARSAVRWPEKMNKTTPILVMHGSSDWRVSPQSAFNIANALYRAHHPFRFVFFEGGDHGLTEHQGEVDRLMKDWLDRYVRDRTPWPSLRPHGG
jgi:dipeptidyl aminopeptidase/acylaminoacyl peptidase